MDRGDGNLAECEVGDIGADRRPLHDVTAPSR
jgi:hypothetical protein